VNVVRTSRRRTGFWIACVVGWCVIGYGIVGLVGAKGGAREAWEVAAWVAGGHVVHDLVVLPLTVLVGFGVARLVGPPWRGPVRAGLMASAVIVAVAYPALRGFGRKPGNPSVLPLDYATATLTVLGVAWAIVALWVSTRVWRRRATRSDGG
jgi:hypothetical protein